MAVVAMASLVTVVLLNLGCLNCTQDWLLGTLWNPLPIHRNHPPPPPPPPVIIWLISLTLISLVDLFDPVLSLDDPLSIPKVCSLAGARYVVSSNLGLGWLHMDTST